MKYYFLIKKKGKCYCSTYLWKVSESFETKKAVKSRFGNVKEIYTEEQLLEKYKSAAALIKDRATVY